MGFEEAKDIRYSMKIQIKSRMTGLKATDEERQKALRWATTLCKFPQTRGASAHPDVLQTHPLCSHLHLLN